eukprot:2098988-Rhodomonas_salina.1
MRRRWRREERRRKRRERLPVQRQSLLSASLPLPLSPLSPSHPRRAAQTAVQEGQREGRKTRGRKEG